MPLTMISPLKDLQQTYMGRILFRSIMGTVEKDYKKALAMPDSLERDAYLKNAAFALRMMPNISIRSMAMTSDGRFTYAQARGFVELANGHLVKGMQFMREKQNGCCRRKKLQQRTCEKDGHG